MGDLKWESRHFQFPTCLFPEYLLSLRTWFLSACAARSELASLLAPGPQLQPVLPLPASWAWVGGEDVCTGVGAHTLMGLSWPHCLSLPISSPKGTKPYFFPLSVPRRWLRGKQSLAVQGLKIKHSERGNKPGSCSGSSEPTPG